MLAFYAISFLSLLGSVVVEKYYNCDELNSLIYPVGTSIFNESVVTKSLKFEEFQSLNDIQFNCTKPLGEIGLIQLIPANELILNNSLDFSQLFFKNNKYYSFYFANFKGIDLFTNTYFGLKETFKTAYILEIDYSKFEISVDDRLFSPIDCDAYEIKKNFFTRVDFLILNNVMYSKNICPLIFANSVMEILDVQSVSNSFINQNQLGFLSLNESRGKLIWAKINRLNLGIAYETVTPRLIDKYLFRNIYFIRIEGLIYDIDEDVFKDLNKIAEIFLSLDDLRRLFYKGNKWMKSIRHNKEPTNLNTSLNLHNKNLNLIIRNMNTKGLTKNYDYPDEDICLFVNFPHEKLVYPIIDPGSEIKCSCTILWLIQYSFKYVYELTDRNYSIFDYHLYNVPLSYCLLRHDYAILVRTCEFEKKIQKCNKTTMSFDINAHGYSWLDLINFFKMCEFILIIVLNPIFAGLGLVSNLIIIIVVYKLKPAKTKAGDMKKKKDNMYKHMVIHSVFNVVFCLIMSLKPINECLFLYSNSFFCSKFVTKKWAQYFKIFIIEFLGNVAKICSNVSYIGITLSRLILMQGKTKGFYKIFDKLKIKIYVFSLICVSHALSIYKLFDFKIDSLDFNILNTKEFPSEIRFFIFCLSSPAHASECKFFDGIKIFNNVLNDVVFFVIILLLDLMLLKGITDMIKKKKKMVENFKEKEEETKRKKINKMIVINGCIYVFSHLPEFIATILIIGFKNFLTPICLNLFRCDKLNEMVQFFYYVSMISQFFINMKFNQNFNKGFRNLILFFKKN